MPAKEVSDVEQRESKLRLQMDASVAEPGEGEYVVTIEVDGNQYEHGRYSNVEDLACAMFDLGKRMWMTICRVTVRKEVAV